MNVSCVFGCHLQSDHVLFCADGALQFAKRHGIEEVSTDYLVTEKAKRRLANFPNFPPSLKVEFYERKSEWVPFLCSNLSPVKTLVA